MRIPTGWLAEFVDLDGVSESDLAERLTMVGLEVEEIQDVEGERVMIGKVTPNRGDWLSVLGVGREASAALDRPVAWRPPVLPEVNSGEIASLASVVIENPQWCPRYAGALIRGVSHRQSPPEVQKRLLEAGMRPINAVVDVTNYVMIELGQPLHAFDYDTLSEHKVVIRAARDGEKILTLDGSERALSKEILVIADANKPIAVAGLMGGSETEVTEKTTNVFLESAHFDAVRIRKGARELGLSTEASYRFERFVDPELVPVALARAAELIARYSGGEVVPGSIDVYPAPIVQKTIDLRPARVEAILGTEVSVLTITRALARLGLEVIASGDHLSVSVPTYRPDIAIEVDLIEEICRIVGYERLAETVPPARGPGGCDSAMGLFDGCLRAILIGQGMVEAFTHALTASSAFDNPEKENERVRVRSALSTELTGLRQSLLPNLLEAMALNLRHRQTEVSLFEVGKTYVTRGEGDYAEPHCVAGVLTGAGVDYLSARGVVEKLAEALHLPGVSIVPGKRHGMHPGRTGIVIAGEHEIGFVAEADPYLVREKLAIPSSVGRVACFELDAQALREIVDGNPTRYTPLPRFPSIVRDLALLFDADVPYLSVSRAARAAAGDLLEAVDFLSVYSGEKVPTGKKSVAIRLVIRARDRTLADADADRVVDLVRAELTDKLGALVR